VRQVGFFKLKWLTISARCGWIEFVFRQVIREPEIRECISAPPSDSSSLISPVAFSPMAPSEKDLRLFLHHY